MTQLDEAVKRVTAWAAELDWQAEQAETEACLTAVSDAEGRSLRHVASLHRNHAADLRLLLEAVRGEWRPISEAPKDGIEIDIWVSGPGARRVADCRWGTPRRANWGDRYGDDKNLPDQWMTRDATALDRRNGEATHFMPLPSPPKESGHG